MAKRKKQTASDLATKKQEDVDERIAELLEILERGKFNERVTKTSV